MLLALLLINAMIPGILLTHIACVCRCLSVCVCNEYAHISGLEGGAGAAAESVHDKAGLDHYLAAASRGGGAGGRRGTHAAAQEIASQPEASSCTKHQPAAAESQIR